MTYDLVDAQGQMLRQGEHLLSLRDLNRSEIIEQMMDAGISSFKIEGRLKAIPYVRNVTAHYRQLLDEILARRGDQFQRPSWGRERFAFTPQPEATFARPFTSYNTPLGRPIPVDSITPYSNKSLGQAIGTVLSSKGREIVVKLLRSDLQLANGDGLVGYSSDRRLLGAQVNQVTSLAQPDHYRLRLSQPLALPRGTTLSVSYTHLDVYKRQPVAYTVHPLQLYARSHSYRRGLCGTLSLHDRCSAQRQRQEATHYWRASHSGGKRDAQVG